MTSEHEHGPAASGVVRHLVHCRPCRESLATLSDEDAAVAFLEAQRDEPGAVTTVDRVLASTATAGKQLVADLIYELAKGCLLSDEEFARLVKPEVVPREVDVVYVDLTSTSDRVVGVPIEVARICREAKPQQATTEECRQLGRELLRALCSLEGTSGRGRLLAAHQSASFGAVDDALREFEKLTVDASQPRRWRRMAVIGFARSCLLADDYEGLLSFVERARHHGLVGVAAEFYAIAAAVCDGDRRAAEQRLDAMLDRPMVCCSSEFAVAVPLAEFIEVQLGLEATTLSSRVRAA